MKKYLKLLVFLLLLLVTGCESKIEKLKKGIEIHYVENDNKDSVTKNFYLPLEVDGYPLTWETGSPYLEIDGEKVTIKPDIVDTNATLSASFVYKEKSYSVHFIITIIKVEEEIEPFDTDTIKNQINIPTETKSDIFLPTLIDGVAITWISLNEDVISNTGVVSPQDEDVTVTLEATFKKYVDKETTVETTLTYSVTILGKDSGLFDFTSILSQIEIPSETDVDLLLPTLIDGVTITWVSSDESVISNTGVVVRQSEDKFISLVAKLKKGSSEKNILYNITVLKGDVDPITNIVFEGYYISLAGLRGNALKEALKTLIQTSGTAIGKYENQVRDADNCLGQQCYLIYSGMGDYGNREHVWPDSLLGSVKNDLHNLRSANISVNSSRSNYPFTENTKPFTGNEPYRLIGKAWYPGDKHIGDVARIVFYVSIRYNLSLNKVGNLELFLKWHNLDPVDDFERARNESIFRLQNNRNPFIDHPELAEIYFGPSTTSFTIPLSLISATLAMNSHYNTLIN